MQYLQNILIDNITSRSNQYTNLACSSSPSMESNMQLPPGFRFHPSDEELIVHYLNNKVTSNLLPASIIADIDLYKYNPWELPSKALFGEDEWYFFTPRDRKYPNGARPNRAAASGFWKATGTDKPILNSTGTMSVGVKKALVFYKGRPPRGVKTEWIMHEYRVPESMNWNSKRKGGMRLDDWVLCRVREKSSAPRSDRWEDRKCSSYGPSGSYLSKANELLRVDTNPNMELIKNYLYNDCPMLPFLFSDPNFPCNETKSTISFQGSDRSCSPTSVQKNSFDDKDSLFTVTSFDNLFDYPTKRKLAGRDLQENLVQRSKKVAKGEVDMKDDVTCTSNDGTVVNFSGGDHSDSSHFSPPWNSLVQYQEFDHLAFTESD